MKTDNNGLPLPIVIDPPRVCVTLMIPNDENHIRAFWGQLYALTYWNEWQKDPLKRGKDAAAVWMEVWRNARATNAYLEGCEGSMAITDIRLNDCSLEVKYNGSDDWIDLGSVTACAPPQTRVRIEDCVLQETLDGGGTWIDKGEIDCGDGTGTPPTQIQVVDCQIQVSGDEGSSWENVPGGAFYPLDASCPAIAFWARHDLPYLLGMEQGTDANMFRLGVVPSGDVWLTAYNRRLALRYGVDIEYSHAYDVDGRVTLDNIPGSGSPLNGFVWENNGDFYLQNGLNFRDYGSTESNQVVASVVASRVSPTDEAYRGKVDLFVHDYTGTKTLISGGINDADPTIGVLGALGTVRQPIDGDCQGNTTLKAMLEAMAGFGWIEDNTTLGTPPPPNPGDDAFKEAFRCRVARGGIDFLIEMYSEAVDICCNESILDIAIKKSEVQSRMVYLQTNSTETDFGETDFSSWVALVTNFNADCDLAEQSRDDVLEARAAIQQVYYCALSEDGTLSPLGYDQLMIDLAAVPGMDVASSEALQLFCSYFKLASWAMINSHGYFFTASTDCEFVDCEFPEDWVMSWHFPTNSGSTTWTITNGNYTSFVGWRHDSIGSPLVMENAQHVKAFSMEFDVNTDEGVTVQVFDKVTNALLVSEGGTGGFGGFFCSWEAATPDDEAIGGIEIRMLTSDSDSDDFTNARIIDLCLEGRYDPPTGGDPGGSCV